MTPTQPSPSRAPAPAMDRLAAAVPDLWHELGPMCRDLPPEQARALAARLDGYLREDGLHADHACELSNDLRALHAGYCHFDADERAVLVGATSYLLTDDDVCPDHEPGGLDDDDRVVRACVRILLRGAV